MFALTNVINSEYTFRPTAFPEEFVSWIQVAIRFGYTLPSTAHFHSLIHCRHFLSKRATTKNRLPSCLPPNCTAGQQRMADTVD
jgi:hypothetical protein